MKLPTTIAEKIFFNSQIEDKPKVKRRAKPRAVNLMEGDDFRCALYGSMGFSTYFIKRHTKFTESQIAYRLMKGNIRRTDFRKGQSSVAASLLRHSRTVAIPAVKQHLKEVMKKMPSQARRLPGLAGRT